MLEKIINKLKDKNVAILGFGIEGKSTYNFIRRHLANQKLTIICKEKVEDEILRKDKLVSFVTGDEYLEGLEKYDLILKSPGISFKDINISKFQNKISSQLELFLENANCKTIGITGTKGKSTTSTLIYNILIEQGKSSYLLGNIGVPIFDKLEEIDEKSIVVLEISSHSLQYLKKSTNIAILLNIYEEHLDHYKDFDEYINAKLNIFKYQDKNDIAVFNSDNKNINFKFKLEDYSITLQGNNKTNNNLELRKDKVFYNDKIIYDVDNTINLKGEHNVNNIMFALAVSNILKLNMDKVIDTIRNFKPLEHRLEYVGTIDEVIYYNDSIATIPEATIASIKSLEKVNTLIVGGKDRGVNLEELIKFLKTDKVKNIICLPKTGEYIAEGLKNSDKNIVQVLNMEEAVREAKRVTEKNTICLLSPAASSYGYFRNFIERGNLFKKYILN